MATTAAPVLETPSNVRIFEALAMPHLVDSRRIEQVKHFNQLTDLPVGKAVKGLSAHLDADALPDPASLSDASVRSKDSIDMILADSLRRTTPPVSGGKPRSPPRRSPSPQSPLPRSPLMRSPSRSPTPDTPPTRRSQRSPPFNLGVSGPALPTYHDNNNDDGDDDDDHDHRYRSPSVASSASSRSRGAALSSDEREMLAEMERLQGNLGRRRPITVDAMQSRQSSRRAGASQPHDYAELYHQEVRNWQKNIATGGANGGGAYRPSADPDYNDKKEILIELDEMRQMGFSVPTYDIQTPLEDLQSDLHRRTVSMGTISTLNSVINGINITATILQALAGPFLPLETYAKDVKTATSTPRFKYCLYQIILRWRGRSGLNPYAEVLSILVMPIIQALLIKGAQWIFKGRSSMLTPGAIQSGIKMLFGLFKGDPNAGVPSGIAGVSADSPTDAATASEVTGTQETAVPAWARPPDNETTPPATGTTGAFGGNYPRANLSNRAKTTPQPRTTPTNPSGEEAVKTRRRLRPPHEIMQDRPPPGVVLTQEQVDSGVMQI